MKLFMDSESIRGRTCNISAFVLINSFFMLTIPDKNDLSYTKIYPSFSKNICLTNHVFFFFNQSWLSFLRRINSRMCPFSHMPTWPLILFIFSSWNSCFLGELKVETSFRIELTFFYGLPFMAWHHAIF